MAPIRETLTSLDRERVIHSLKTAIACLIGLALTRIVHFAVDQWLVITIAVVMCGQLNTGSMINKSSMRFLGTLCGTLIGALTIALFGTNTLICALIIALSTLVFSYIATGEKSYSEAGTLGAVTVIIILLGPIASVEMAGFRFLEISTGILIAACISQFLIPIHARDHLRIAQAKTINQLCQYYRLCFIDQSEETDILELDEAVIRTLTAQRKLANDSAKEIVGPAFDADNYMQLLRSEKELFRAVVCLHYASDMLHTKKIFFNELPAIQNFHQQVVATLKKIANGLDKHRPPIETALIPSLQPIRDAIKVFHIDPQNDDMIYLNGFLFCAEIIVLQLTQLVVVMQMRFAPKP